MADECRCGVNLKNLECNHTPYTTSSVSSNLFLVVALPGAHMAVPVSSVPLCAISQYRSTLRQQRTTTLEESLERWVGHPTAA